MSPSLEEVVRRGSPRYSIARAVLGQRQDIDAEHELEISEELLRSARSQRGFRSHGGVLIPPAALFASLTTTGVQAGQELVFRRPVGAVPARHPIPQLAELGATFLFDVRDLVGYTWIEDGYDVEWQASEVPTPGITPTDFVLGSDQPDASSGMVQTIITRRLAAQSTPSVEDLIERDLAAAVASAIDQGGVSGTGTNGEPRGLLARNLKTVSGALTYAALTGGEHYVGSKNEAALDTAWLGSIGARAALRNEFTGGPGGPAWALPAGPFPDTILGRPAAASTTVTPDALIHGPFPTLLLAIHAIELLTDVYTRVRQGEILITAFVTLSVALAHPDHWIVFDGFTVPALP